MIYKCHLFIIFCQNPKRNNVGEGRFEPALSKKLSRVPGLAAISPEPPTPPSIKR